MVTPRNSIPQDISPAQRRRQALTMAASGFAALVAASLFTTLVPAEAKGPKAQRAHISGDLRLEVVAGSWQAIRRDGKATDLSLTAKAKIHQFERSGDTWMVSAVESTAERKSLRLFAGDLETGLRSLPAPVIENSELIAMPTLIATADVSESGSLETKAVDTLLWLEGTSHRHASVRTARWNGIAWEPSVVISPTGAGTQTALVASRLADGSVLAAWAAFDGVDDEIQWSHFDGENWSPPKTMTANRVPDVTPTLIADGAGALVAWSAYDGRDYRVYSARFDGKSWSTPISMGGPGSVRPSFADLGDEDASRVLVFKQAQPDAWVIGLLDEDGNMERSTSMADSQKPRPMIVRSSQQGVQTLDTEAPLKPTANQASKTWVQWDGGATP